MPKEVSFQLLASVKPVTLIPVRAKCSVTNFPLSVLQQGLKAWVETRSRTDKDIRKLLLLEIKYGEHIRTVFLFEHYTKKCCSIFAHVQRNAFPSQQFWLQHCTFHWCNMAAPFNSRQSCSFITTPCVSWTKVCQVAADGLAHKVGMYP